jgi:hypothetical protein
LPQITPASGAINLLCASHDGIRLNAPDKDRVYFKKQKGSRSNTAPTALIFFSI